MRKDLRDERHSDNKIQLVSMGVTPTQRRCAFKSRNVREFDASTSQWHISQHFLQHFSAMKSLRAICGALEWGMKNKRIQLTLAHFTISAVDLSDRDNKKNFGR